MRTSITTLALLATSLASAADVAAGARARSPSTSAPPGAATDQRVRVAWDTPARTPGCFFFSGPGALGRDTHLGEWAGYRERDGAVTLDFGDGAVFTGRRSGDQVQLARRGTYRFGGRWTTTERLTLRVVDGDLRGAYHYDECSDGAAACPGTCHIDAGVAVLLRARPSP